MVYKHTIFMLLLFGQIISCVIYQQLGTTLGNEQRFSCISTL